MTLSPRIALRQSQKLVLNPQMQQSIELLLLTNKQLSQMLKKEMEQNLIQNKTKTFCTFVAERGPNKGKFCACELTEEAKNR